MILRFSAIALVTAFTAGPSALPAQVDPASCSGTVSFRAEELDEHGSPTGFTATELECEGEGECQPVSAVGPHGTYRRHWCGAPGEPEPDGCRAVVRASTRSGGGPAIAFCAGTCEKGPCRPHVADLEETGSGIKGILSCRCGGDDEDGGEDGGAEDQPGNQPPGRGEPGERTEQDEMGDLGENGETDTAAGAGGAGASEAGDTPGREDSPAPEVDVDDGDDVGDGGDQQMSSEEAADRVRKIKEDLDELRKRFEEEGRDTRFLDDFEDELEEMQKEWDEAGTVPRSVLDRLKNRLKGKMAQQKNPDGSRVFEDEEIEELVDETFGVADEGGDDEGNDGAEENGGFKEAQDGPSKKPGVPDDSGSSRRVPPGDAPKPEVDDLLDLGTVAPGLYDFPITAANTSCRGKHTFRISFEPVEDTAEPWLTVVGPRSLEGIAMNKEKTTQAKVDLRDVPPGTVVEGVLRIECITCPPPPACTQNQRTFLVRAKVAE